MPCTFNWTGSAPETRRALWQKKAEHGSSLVVHVHEMNRENLGQDREFTGRTSLLANWFEAKDVSLRLTHLSLNDTGDYECHVITQRPPASSLCTDVKLTVTPGEQFPLTARLQGASLGFSSPPEKGNLPPAGTE
ncbi:hypothetical protein chiPu_0022277, partial [Chiloscyllium punctatum]|nr:hypothetical protein [Chiloscyllium punctatum]